MSINIVLNHNYKISLRFFLKTVFYTYLFEPKLAVYFKNVFLKVFYMEALLFLFALHQRNIDIGILYLDSNQRKLYVQFV